MAKLLSISEAASIAIHSLALIANTKEFLNAGQLAEKLGFSKNHLAKILQMLVKYNYLDSERGPKGGFRLKANPQQISLLEIYELVEGQLVDDKCAHNRYECPFEECVYGDFRIEINQKVKDYFSNRKLSDITTKK